MRRYALRKILLTLLAAICASQIAAQSGPPAQTDFHESARTQNPRPPLRFGRLPLSFEANQGQADERVKFLSRGQGYTLFLSPSKALFALRRAQTGKESTELEGIAIRLVGANPESQIVGSNELSGTVSYFIGNDPSKWITSVPTHAKARYQQIYPGVDLVFYGNEQQLESDFVIAPGADPHQIRLRFEGGKALRLSGDGDLIVKTSQGEVRLLRPHVYQNVAGTRRDVNGHYVLHGTRTVSFSVGAYNHESPLVIDPVLVYSTALNGANFTVGNGGGHGIAVDMGGNAYVTGYTDRSNFLPTPGAFATATGLLFVTKINPTGSGVVYTAVFGGSGADVAMAVAVDAQNEPVVAGFTSSADFPTLNPMQATLPAGTHAFVTKLDAAGSSLLYSTLLGGSGATGVGNASDAANAVTTDTNGALYVTGYTNSVDFPTKNAVQATCPDLQQNGYCNVQGFVTKLDPTQSGPASLVYSTYLGGKFPTAGQGIAVDASGNAYITGSTNATDFPTTPGVFQTTLVGGSDAFVSVLNPTGSSFVYSTYLGYGFGWGIAVDAQGNAYVTGATGADVLLPGTQVFPTTPGAFQTTILGTSFGTYPHAFVSKLNPSGSGLVYSTFLEGSMRENGNTGDIAVDPLGNAYVSGYTASTDFPTANAVQGAFGGGNSDAFVAKLNPAGSGLVYSTYLGGSGDDTANGIAVDASGNAYVMGTTTSANFPTTPSAFEPTVNTSTGSLFVAKIGAAPTTTTLAASVNPSVFGQQVSFTATVSPVGSSSPTPTGVVTFSDGATTLGTATISSGTAIFITSSLTVGSHSITAAYGGDSNFAPSTSIPLTQVVSQAGTATTVSASPSSSLFGQPVILTANVGVVAPGAGTPTGTVTFLDGAALVGTSALSNPGSTTFSTSSLSAGSHSLTASYAGDTNFTASTAPPVTLTVQSSAPATHLAVTAPASATAGMPFSVTVMALDASNNQLTGYAGTVRFASTDSQAALPSTYTFTAADHGTHVFIGVTLNTPGNQTITATDTTNVAITGTSAAISVTSAVPPPVQIIDNETVTVSDAESFPDVFDAEAVRVTDAVFVTPLIAVGAPVAEFSAGGLGFGGQSGTQTITVSDIGGALLTLASTAVSGSAQFSITQISCSNGATSLSTQLPSGGVCTLTINYVTSGTPANDNAVLVFNDNAALSNLPTTPSGASYTQSVPLTGGGTNIGPPPPPPAVVPIVDNEVVQVTDTSSFTDVFDSETITVNDQVSVQVISIPTTTSISANTVTFGTPVSVVVSVTSAGGVVTGSVTLSVDGGTPSSTPLSAGSATFNLGALGAGNHRLSATFAAQGAFNASSTTGTIIINQATPVIAWPPPAPITLGTPLSSAQLDATAGVPGTFLYTPPVGSVLSVGTQTLSALFTPSDSVDYTTATATVSLSVLAPLAITSAAATAFTEGAANSFTITTSGVPTPAITESGSLPQGLTFVDGGNGTATLAGTPATGSVGGYPITIVAKNSLGAKAQQYFTLSINAPIVVPKAYTITSPDHATFYQGFPDSFTITTTGSPVPKLTLTPPVIGPGVTFVDHQNRTATLSYDGNSGLSPGTYTFTVTATGAGGAAFAAVQNFTLQVLALPNAPTFTSADQAVFKAGSFNIFTIAAGPMVTSITESGPLPAGVIFGNINGTAALIGVPVSAAPNGSLFKLSLTASNPVVAGYKQTEVFTLLVEP